MSNREIIEEYMNTVWNKKDLSPVDSLFSRDAKIHSALGKTFSAEKMKNTIYEWMKAIPDMKVTLLRTFEEGDTVISHWRAEGTQEGSLNGFPGKGNRLDYKGVTLYKMADGKVVEYWAYLDTWTLEKQMTGTAS